MTRCEKFYKNRKLNGLCPRCGKKLDRNGHYCRECLEKVNKYNRDTRKFLISIGICPICRKEKLFGDEKSCIICRGSRGKYNITEEQRKKYNEKFRIKQKIVYQNRSDNGICTRCGKRKAAAGRKKCNICLEKNANIKRNKA